MIPSKLFLVSVTKKLDHLTMTEIIGGLERYMEENGIRDLAEIRGIVS